MNSGQTHTSPSQTLLLLFSFRVKHRTCNADDGPLCRVQHVSGGWLGALHAMVFGQVPGQRVSRWRRVSHRAQVAGALLRCGPDQRPPLGLVLHLLHGLDWKWVGKREKHKLTKPLRTRTKNTEQIWWYHIWEEADIFKADICRTHIKTISRNWGREGNRHSWFFWMNCSFICSGSQKGLQVILSDRFMIFGRRHCCWVFFKCITVTLWAPQAERADNSKLTTEQFRWINNTTGTCVFQVNCPFKTKTLSLWRWSIFGQVLLMHWTTSPHSQLSFQLSHHPARRMLSTGALAAAPQPLWLDGSRQEQSPRSNVSSAPDTVHIQVLI